MNDTMMDTDFSNDSNECMDNKSAGRWTSEEHTLFLKGLELYNKQWKNIADLVKTRTVVQIRTHAQKYFQKLEKGKMSGTKKDGVSVDCGMLEYKNASSRTSSISSADSFTTSEGESDSERGMSIGSMEDSSHLMITLPIPKSRSNSKSKLDSPKKRSRDGKQTKGGKKIGMFGNEDDAIDFPIPNDMGVNGDVLFDFMQLENYEAEDLDHSIINLLEKIDWNVPGSRPHSPFMDSATYVNASMDSWDGSETNSQFSEFHNASEGFLGEMTVESGSSNEASSSFSSSANLQQTVYVPDSNKVAATMASTLPTFSLPLISPTTITASNLYSPVASGNMDKVSSNPEYGTFPFDQNESELNESSDFDQPRKRGRSIADPISTTTFALADKKVGFTSTSENIGDKFEDLLDSGILLDSF